MSTFQNRLLQKGKWSIFIQTHIWRRAHDHDSKATGPNPTSPHLDEAAMAEGQRDYARSNRLSGALETGRTRLHTAMAESQRDHARRNRLLGALETASRQRIDPHLEPIKLKLGVIVCEAGGFLKHAYFPQGAVLSLLLRQRIRLPLASARQAHRRA